MNPSSLKPAPTPLLLVQEFVNTRDIEAGGDDLGSPGALRLWCLERGLVDAEASVTDADLAAAVDLREGLRGLLEAHTDAPLRSDDLDRVNAAARRAPLVVAFTSDGAPVLAPVPTGGAGPALGRIGAAVYTGALDGTWDRLKACRADDCRWAFYDRSRNRSGRWCDMEGCGSRSKVRAFRARRTTR
jgi:predicted RNA-binding Zn ribbon-like protein